MAWAQLNVRLEAELVEGAKAEAARRGLPLATLVRVALLRVIGEDDSKSAARNRTSKAAAVASCPEFD